MGMTPLTFIETLQYLAGLGQRHSDVKTSAVALPEQFKAPKADGFPLVLIEADPAIEEATPGLDIYSFAIQFLGRLNRTDSIGNAELVTAAKLLCDEYVDQLRWEKRVEIDGKPSAVPMYCTGTDALATGVRLDIRLKVQRTLTRAGGAAKFKDAAQFPYTLPIIF